jgi:LDH2 family malate/lactate/ureidoglycolate dehydrogenase
MVERPSPTRPSSPSKTIETTLISASHSFAGSRAALATAKIVTQLIERIKATPRRPGVDDIRIPSERAFHSRERALCEGLEIDRVVFDALVALRAR